MHYLITKWSRHVGANSIPCEQDSKRATILVGKRQQKSNAGTATFLAVKCKLCIKRIYEGSSARRHLSCLWRVRACVRGLRQKRPISEHLRQREPIDVSSSKYDATTPQNFVFRFVKRHFFFSILCCFYCSVIILVFRVFKS